VEDRNRAVDLDEGCPWEKLEVQTERNGVQMLFQIERMGVSALLRAKRRTDIEITEVEREGWCICTYKG